MSRKDEREFEELRIDIDLTKSVALADVRKYLAEFAAVYKGLADEGRALQSVVKRTKESVSQSFYVEKGYAQQLERAAKFVGGRMGGEDAGSIFRYSVSSAERADFQKKILEDKRELAAVQAKIARLGGSLSASGKEGYYDISAPEAARSEIMKEIAAANKRTREKQRALVQEYAPEAYENINAAGLKGDKRDAAMAIAAKEATKSRDSALKKIVTGGPEDKEDDKQKSMQSVKFLAAIYVIKRILTAIFSIAKDIRDAMLDMTSRTVQATATGNRLGLSATDILRYERAEIAKGLEKGTFAGAMGSVQAKFSDVTHLNEEAIKRLAFAIGPDVERVIGNAVGRNDPQAIMDLIISGYMKKVKSGLDTSGGYIGEAGAIGVWAQHLEATMGKEFVDIFLRQYQDTISASRPDLREVGMGPTSAWAMYNGVSVNAGGLTGADMESMRNVDRTLKDLYAVVAGLFDKFKVMLAKWFDPLVIFLRGVARKFMDAPEAAADVILARQENRAKLLEAETAIVSQESLVNAQYEAARQAFIKTGVKGEFGPAMESFLSKQPNSVLASAITSPGGSAFLDAALAYAQAVGALTELKKFKDTLTKEIGSANTNYVSGDALTMIRKGYEGTLADYKATVGKTRLVSGPYGAIFDIMDEMMFGDKGGVARAGEAETIEESRASMDLAQLRQIALSGMLSRGMTGPARVIGDVDRGELVIRIKQEGKPDVVFNVASPLSAGEDFHEEFTIYTKSDPTLRGGASSAVREGQVK